MQHRESSLILKNTNIAVGGRTLFYNFNLEVYGGEICALMGGSGAGKSTLLSFITGVLEPEFKATGEIILNKENIENLMAEKRRIGVLFQDALLFPHMTVLENVIFGTPQALSKKEKKERALEKLKLAELEEYADYPPEKLSGGQQARVALMRSLVSEPRALALDEPFSKLDEGLRSRLGDFISKMVAAAKIPAIVVTHDIRDADKLGAKVVNLPHVDENGID